MATEFAHGIHEECLSRESGIDTRCSDMKEFDQLIVKAMMRSRMSLKHGHLNLVKD